MPTFCRHNRLEANCPICSRQARPSAAPARRPVRRPADEAAARRRAPRVSGDLRLRRIARAADDGYEHGLVPGLRATIEAVRLADELAFAAARLRELDTDPPGLYGEVAAGGDVEEAAWLAFLIAYLSPLEEGDPFRAIQAARVPWATGELPALDGVATGPRTAHDPARGTATPAAYRAWAARAGSQEKAYTGEASWPAQRRFDRAFERLALPGLRRGGRYELLVLLGHLGVVAVRPWSLQLTDPTDPVTVAAKRVFGIGDALNLQRRAGELATAARVPIEALDLALVNWSRAPAEARIRAGARTPGDPDLRAAIGAALGVPPAAMV